MAALTRLQSFYNGRDYDPGANPGGMANAGNAVNFEPSLRDIGLVATKVGAAADAIQVMGNQAGAAVPNLTVMANVSGALAAMTATPIATLAAVLSRGLFYKTDPATVALTKTTAGTLSLKAGTVVEVAGSILTFAADTAVTMPALTAGTDYAVYLCADGSVRADAGFTAPAGYTAATSRRIGGGHYDLTGSFNAYSLWDLKWRPACADPRGMVLVAGAFWADIYLLGVNHPTAGTSAAGQTIADGASPPKIPSAFGGTGSNSYGDLTWWTAAEVMAAYGKRLPTYQEFAALAYGVTENQSVGSDPVTTQHQAGYTSKWGIEQATGVMTIWGREFAGPYGLASYQNNNGGRGATSDLPNAAAWGGNWGDAANSGSRLCRWDMAPTNSGNFLTARGVCNHLALST